jgi:hypothetical protein
MQEQLWLRADYRADPHALSARAEPSPYMLHRSSPHLRATSDDAGGDSAAGQLDRGREFLAAAANPHWTVAIARAAELARRDVASGTVPAAFFASASGSLGGNSMIMAAISDDSTKTSSSGGGVAGTASHDPRAAAAVDTSFYRLPGQPERVIGTMKRRLRPQIASSAAAATTKPATKRPTVAAPDQAPALPLLSHQSAHTRILTQQREIHAKVGCLRVLFVMVMYIIN